MCRNKYFKYRTTYVIEGMDGRVYHRVWKKRYARFMVNNPDVFGFPETGICYKVTKRGRKAFCFMW